MFRCTNREALFIGAYKGPVNVLGSARCVWDDLRDSPYPKAPTIATNVTGCFAPRMMHWVSVHRELFAHAMPLRKLSLSEDYKQALGREAFFTHAWKQPGEQVDYIWHGDIVPDTSGCFAVMLAILFGFDPIIMCGIPLDNSGRFHAPHCEDRTDAYVQTNGTWQWLRDTHADKVRSMSGLTQEWFGKP